MRTCSRCGVEKPLDEFHRDKRGGGGHTYKCKPCNIARVKEWVAANPERARENGAKRQRAYRDRNPGLTAEKLRTSRMRGRTFIDAQKAGLPCAKCGLIFPPVAMDWHHRDPQSKRFTIGAHTNYALESLAAEIAKCDLLCATCHRVESAA